MKKIIFIHLLFFAASTLTATKSYAHHAFAATFTTDTATVEGYVEELRFNNPHVMVSFNVADEYTEVTEWVTVGAAATSLRRLGWSRTTLKKGDYIRVSGNTSRNGSPMVSMGTLEVLDPETKVVIRIPGSDESTSYAAADTTKSSVPLKQENGLPNLTGTWTMGYSGGRPSRDESAQGQGMEAPPVGRGAPGERRDGRGEGEGGPNPSEGPAPFNEAGAALQAAVELADDPQVQCNAPGLVRQAGFTPHPIRIEQHKDHIVISYEEYGGVRKVYFDDRERADGGKTNLGLSQARYEGDKLIIESNKLLSNWSSPGGEQLSDQVSTVETYSRKPDVNGTSVLAMRMVITDPVYLTETWTMSQDKYYRHGYEFISVQCEKPL